ncbi:MAG: hypothetical protein ACOX4F_09675 [Atopobiaceae bacterium]
MLELVAMGVEARASGGGKVALSGRLRWSGCVGLARFWVDVSLDGSALRFRRFSAPAAAVAAIFG